MKKDNAIKREYDVVASFYNKYWRSITLEIYSPIIEEKILKHIPASGLILDVCCGTGTLAAELSTAGYNVWGLDISPKMIEYAKKNAPKAVFSVKDATDFTYDIQFDAVICTMDSLNCMTGKKKLYASLSNIYHVLKEGGLFYFDIRNEDGYNAWNNLKSNIIDADGVIAIVFAYFDEDKTGFMKIAYFYNLEGWQREDIFIVQYFYSDEEIMEMLQEIGFKKVEVTKFRDMPGSDIMGRSQFLCKK